MLTAFSALAATCPKVSQSCTTKTEFGYVCTDLIEGVVDAAVFKSECEKEAGNTYSDKSCPSDSKVGSCVLGDEGVDLVVLRLYSPIPADYVELICAQSQGLSCK